MSEDLSMRKALFFPYYVNQSRLLDVFAILNGGFSEYEELQLSETRGSKKSASAKVEAGLRVFKFGGSAGLDGDWSSSAESRSSQKKVHTTTSMLKAVLEELDDAGYLREINKAQSGDFTVVPVNLRVNSIKSLVDEAAELTELGQKLTSLGNKTGANKAAGGKGAVDIGLLRKVSGAVHELFGAEEIVSDAEGFAVVAELDDGNLYQAERRNIINVDMMCLGQVRRVHENGAQLLRNTVFAKMQDATAKRSLLDSLATLSDGSKYRYDSVAIPSIEGKPVYELEIVALFQDTYPSAPDGGLEH